jgi:putative membrane protein insertion efficiency factor
MKAGQAMSRPAFACDVRAQSILGRLSFRRALAILAVIAALALMTDLRRAPSEQWSTRAALFGIRVYQVTLSSWMPALGVQCRFNPTCSRYAAVVVARDGVVRGGWLTARRLVRCGPWTPSGTSDPP